mgnify:CR=1 FL=1
MRSKQGIPDKDNRYKHPARGKLRTAWGKMLGDEAPHHHLHGGPISDLNDPWPTTAQKKIVAGKKGKDAPF